MRRLRLRLWRSARFLRPIPRSLPRVGARATEHMSDVFYTQHDERGNAVARHRIVRVIKDPARTIPGTLKAINEHGRCIVGNAAYMDREAPGWRSLYESKDGGDAAEMHGQAGAGSR